MTRPLRSCFAIGRREVEGLVEAEGVDDAHHDAERGIERGRRCGRELTLGEDLCLAHAGAHAAAAEIEVGIDVVARVPVAVAVERRA